MKHARLLLLLLFACGAPEAHDEGGPASHETSRTQEPQRDEQQGHSQSAVELLPMAADELAPTLSARTESIVVLNIWSTWCPPCIEEFPMLLNVGRRYADRGVALVFVSVDFEEARDDATAFVRAQGAPAPAYIKVGPDGAFIAAVHDDWTGSLPATVIFSRRDDGTLSPIKFWEGPLTQDEFEGALNAALL